MNESIPTGKEALSFLERISQAPIESQIIILGFIAFIVWTVIKELSEWKKNKDKPDPMISFSSALNGYLKQVEEVTTQIAVYNKDFPRVNGQITALVDGQKIFNARIDSFKNEVGRRFDKGESEFKNLSNEIKGVDTRLTNYIIEQAERRK